MNNKYFALLTIGFAFAFSQFVSATSLNLKCAMGPDTDWTHPHYNKIVTVTINDELSHGTAYNFGYTKSNSTELSCNRSSSSLQCDGVVCDYNYPRGTKIELFFAQQDDNYTLTSIYQNYGEPNQISVFYCKTEP